MVNPPFNVNAVDKEKMEGDPRFKELGLPKADNANYIWIHLFYSALNKTGWAGFVMANSASDARGSELEIRRKLIQAEAVDVMLTANVMLLLEGQSAGFITILFILNRYHYATCITNSYSSS